MTIELKKLSNREIGLLLFEAGGQTALSDSRGQMPSTQLCQKTADLLAELDRREEENGAS